jgi:dipeptidyl aminopeptidase/acylaminoacyl peptidase
MSPDGSHVLVTVRRTDTPSTYATRIAIVGTGARAPTRFLSAGPRDSAPRWSPDGTSIAFVRAKASGHPQLMLMRLGPRGRAGTVRALTKLPEGKFGDIRWSPDGLRIAFAFRATPAERTSDAAKDRARKHRSTPPMEIADPWYRLDGDGYFGAARHALHMVDLRTGAVGVIDAKDTMVPGRQRDRDLHEPLAKGSARAGEERAQDPRRW